MASYVIDPDTGERKKVSGTNYIPPCVAKNQARKAKQEPIITETVTDETTHKDTDTNADKSS